MRSPTAQLRYSTGFSVSVYRPLLHGRRSPASTEPKITTGSDMVTPPKGSNHMASFADKPILDVTIAEWTAYLENEPVARRCAPQAPQETIEGPRHHLERSARRRPVLRMDRRPDGTPRRRLHAAGVHPAPQEQPVVTSKSRPCCAPHRGGKDARQAASPKSNEPKPTVAGMPRTARRT